MTFLIPRKPVTSYSFLPITATTYGQDQDAARDFEFESSDLSGFEVRASSIKRNSTVAHKTVSEEAKKSGHARILLLCTVVILPMAFLSTTLLLLVFCNQIKNSNTDTSNLLVDYRASRITTLTLVMSTISTWLTTPAMLLLRYHLAKQYVNMSKFRHERLPTPFQLSILIALFGAQIGSLWDWMKYRTRSRSRSSFITPQLSSSAGVLFMLILLSTSMSATDSWFHLTTQSINFAQANVVPMPINHYGRDVTAACVKSIATTSDIQRNFAYPNGTMKTLYLPCSIVPNDDQVQITNASEAFSTANNASLTNAVTLVAAQSKSYALLAQSAPSQGLDFVATTFAASTQCMSIQPECFDSQTSWDTGFNCPLGNFSGIIDTEDKRRDSSPTQWTIGYVDSATNTTTTDALLFMQYPNLSNYTWILVTEIFTGTTHGSTITTFAFACNTSIWNVTYGRTDGQYYLQSQESSNRLTALSLTGPISTTDDSQLSSPRSTLQERFTQIALSNSSTQDMADQFADQYSTVTMAFAAGIVTPILNLNETVHTTILITQLSKAPLFILIALAAIYVIVGILLTTIALLACRPGVDSAQSLLSLSGITATAFEQGSVHVGDSVERVSDLYEEMVTNGKFTSRICIEKAGEGYWQFRALDNLSKDVRNGWLS